MFMKLLISETSVKRFLNKEKYNKGKLGDSIEKLAILYFRDPSIICDTVCIYSNNQYMLIIMTNQYLEYDFETKLRLFIKKFIDVSLFVLVNVVDGCNDD
jgi:hypothetical protein